MRWAPAPKPRSGWGCAPCVGAKVVQRSIRHKLHHSPDTPKAIAEVWRVLKPGGEARIMIYHTWSLVGLMLWVRYAQQLMFVRFIGAHDEYDRIDASTI